VALLPLLVALARHATRPRASTLRAFLLGLVTGLCYFAGTLYWLPDVMVIFGGLNSLVGIALGLLLVAYLAIFPALFASITHATVRHFGSMALILSPATWVSVELARTYALSGFPWVLLGYSQIDLAPIAQVASLFGVYGVSAVTALPAAALAFALAGGDTARGGAMRWLPVAATVLLLGVIWWWGSARIGAGDLLRAGRPLQVGIVQGDIRQDVKWDPQERDRILLKYLTLSRQVAAQGVRLIIWPESATTFMFNEDFLRAAEVRRLARESGAAILFGTDEIERATPPRYYTSAFLVGADGMLKGTYRKSHLVPWGEYVPLQNLLFFVGPLVEGVGGFSPGPGAVALRFDDVVLSTAICYEIVFPRLVADGVTAGSHLLTTLTNDAWYGWSSAPYQHWEQARMRAIEQGRYLVRAAQTGVSGSVDPYGRTLVKTDLFVPAAIRTEVRLLDGTTLYARIGDGFAYACALLTVLMAASAWVAGRRGRG